MAMELPVDEIVLAEGEPTMHPDFVPILEEWVRVEIPLLGWGAEHDRMARTPGSFERIVSTLRLYRGRGVSLTPTTTLTRAGIRALASLRTLAAELDIPFAPSVLVRQGAAIDHWSEISPEGEEIEKQLGAGA